MKIKHRVSNVAKGEWLSRDLYLILHGICWKGGENFLGPLHSEVKLSKITFDIHVKTTQTLFS